MADIQQFQPEEESSSLRILQTLHDIVVTNKPQIVESATKALAALSGIKTVTDEESDKTANNVLVRCNKTLTKIEGLRKEYTSKLDDFKSNEMRLEKQLKDEIARVKQLRDTRAQEKAIEDQKREKEIAEQKAKSLEIARIKSVMVEAVELGISSRISQGETAISKLFDGMTLENFDKEAAKLNFKPLLKPDLFESFLDVDYDKKLVSATEFADIKAKALAHFDYQKCNKQYIEAVTEVVTKWKGQLKARKRELFELQEADEATAAQMKADQEERARAAEKLRKDEQEQRDQEIKLKAEEGRLNESMSAEFESQKSIQEIEEQSGTRGTFSYRLEKEHDIINNPVKLVEILSKIMLHVVTDTGTYKGFLKRNESGYPKVDAKGNFEYIDAVSYWLKALAKVRDAKGNPPEVPGLTLTKDIKTIAKADA